MRIGDDEDEVGGEEEEESTLIRYAPPAEEEKRRIRIPSILLVRAAVNGGSGWIGIALL